MTWKWSSRQNIQFQTDWECEAKDWIPKCGVNKLISVDFRGIDSLNLIKWRINFWSQTENSETWAQLSYKMHLLLLQFETKCFKKLRNNFPRKFWRDISLQNSSRKKWRKGYFLRESILQKCKNFHITWKVLPNIILFFQIFV